MNEEKLGDRVTLCPDGKYRWVYAFPMMKNPTLLFTIWKVLAIASCAPALLVVICELFDGKGFLKTLLSGVEICAVCVLITGVLSVIAYLIVAALYGWHYVVIFEMDETGVLHAQQNRQVSKAQAMGWITAMAGLAAGNVGTMGTGLLAATNTSMHSTFANVKSVRGNRKRNTIYVNETLNRNQVYVRDEDYDFVREYITSRCKAINN